MWTPWGDLRVRAAALFAAVAVAAAIMSGAAAVRGSVVTPPPPVSSAPDAGRQPVRRIDSARLLVELDPFGLSGAGEPVTISAPVAPTPSIVLVGTIIGVEQPAAACRLGDARARILHVGDTLGGWRLERVTPGRAVFIDAGGARHELRLSPLGN